MDNAQQEWQLDGAAPELYERYLVPAMTAMWAADLVERAALLPGEKVLDVACGTGVLSREAARVLGSGGRVAALDINPGMLAVARSLSPAGAAIAWHEGTALALPFATGEFDVAFCQLGLQFVPDRHAALCEIRRVLASSGRFALNVFGPIEHNPATHALANAIDRTLGVGASAAKRTEHALADTAELRTLVFGAGFRNIVIETAIKTVHFPSVTDYVRIQLAATPLASVVARQPAARRDELVTALTRDVATQLSAYIAEDGLRFPQELHVLLAR